MRDAPEAWSLNDYVFNTRSQLTFDARDVEGADQSGRKYSDRCVLTADKIHPRSPNVPSLDLEKTFLPECLGEAQRWLNLGQRSEANRPDDNVAWSQGSAH